MNRPWMPLYIADYRADTAHLGVVEHGAYLLLIMHYWQTGGLPDDDAKLSRIACTSLGQWKKIRPTIEEFFQPGWKHKRIDEEVAHAEEVSSKRRSAAEQRYCKKDAIASAIADQMQTQPQPQPQREERLDTFEKIGRKRNGWSPPKHGAFHREKGLVYVLSDSDEWSAHSDDYEMAHGAPPVPDKGGGYWFKMRGEAA